MRNDVDVDVNVGAASTRCRIHELTALDCSVCGCVGLVSDCLACCSYSQCFAYDDGVIGGHSTMAPNFLSFRRCG